MDNSRLLGDRYEIARHLHAGRVTNVYEASDRHEGRPVIVEVLRDVRGRVPDAASRFKAAGQAAAGLSHPNIVRVLDAEAVGGLAYLVRERGVGATLRETLAQDGRMAPTQVGEIALQVCDALAAAHRRGLVHGGITPSEILVNDDGDVQLTGFGLALSLGSGDGLDMSYAAPEQFLAGAADARSDLYALGSCLYETVLGRAPFAGDPQMLDRLGARVPAALGAILRRLLAADPNDRYQDTSEVEADLRRYLGVAESGAGDGAPRRRPASGADRRPPRRQARSTVAEASQRSLNRSAVVLSAIGVVLVGSMALTVRQLGLGSELAVDSGESDSADVEIGPTPSAGPGQSDTGGVSTSAPTTTTDSTTTTQLSTTTTDPANDGSEDDEDDAGDDSGSDEGDTGPSEPPEDDPGAPPAPSTTASPPPQPSPTSPPTTSSPATVPNVVGMTEGQASDALAAQGLSMSTRRVRVYDGSQDGRVVAQSPGGGSPRPGSGTVSVDVGRYCWLVC